MRCLLRSLACVSVRFCFLIIEFQEFFVYFGNSPSSNVFCKHFPPVCGLSPNSLDSVFWRAKNFNFHQVQLIGYFSHGSLTWYLKRHHCTWGGFPPWVSALVSCDLLDSSTCLLVSLLWIQEELLLFQSVQFVFFNLFSVQTEGWCGKFQTPIWRTGNQKSLSSVNF